MRLLLFFTIVALILTPSFANSFQEHPNIFLEANQAYNKGDYNRAIELYGKILKSGLRNGLLYYNLGNCYYRNGEIGKAILNYRRSELYNPRDEDLKANLNYARQNIKDKVEVSSSKIFERIFFWYYNLNSKELLILFLISNGLFWILAILKLFKPSALLRTTVLIFLFITVLIGISVSTKFYAFKNFKDGVVVSKEISVMSGNGINNTVLFKLHEGTEFSILDSDHYWLKIKLSYSPREMKGWVERKFVGVVN